MSCPVVIEVVTPGPPGIGLPPGATDDVGKFLRFRRSDDNPYDYELVDPDEVGLPQALSDSSSPTFAGLTLSGLGATRLVATGTGGLLQGLTLGSGLSIVDGALVAAGSEGGEYPSLTMPTGFTVSGNSTASLTVAFATGYSLPTTAEQEAWTAGLSDARTPTAHKTTHATGGTDALTPADIGAEVAGAAAAAQSAAIAASAPAEQGVTNGNGHDHSGGDGAQIAYSSLSGLPPLGTAAAADIGTTAGTVPVLDGAGLVPSALLPGFVDDVLEFANLAAFPVTGEAGKLYISLATNRQYRWGGSVYVEINPSPGSTDGVPEGSVNLYFTSGRGESAAASWWAASSAKTKLDGIASGATANATDAALRDRSTHTGTQAAGTITGLATVATSGAYGDLSGRPTLGTSAARDVGTTAGTVAAGDDARLSDARTPTAHTHPASAISDSTTAGRALLTAADAAAQRTTLELATVASTGAYADLSGTPTVPGLSSSTPSALGAAAAGVAASASRADHVHELPATVTTSAAGLQPASGYGTVSYAAQVTIDFAARDRQMATISLTGALEFLSSNLANGREVRLRLVCDSTQRALTFPTDWKFVCAKPANIAASKVAVLSLAAYGTTNADVVAAYAVQP